MFSKNLKYYRLKKALSKKELARMVDVSSMAITNYESGSRKPDMAIIKRLAQALDVRVSDFLSVRNKSLVFSHGEFRKNASLSAERQDYLREYVEEYLNRFMSVVEILGGEVLPDAPSIHRLVLNDDDEENALALRKHLNLAADGPVDNLIGTLENKGIPVIFCEIESGKFSGMNGLVNSRPYIAINPAMTAERNRSTIAHELAHLMFIWPEGICDKDVEKKATSISGAFLFPKSDAIRELGVRRNMVSNDMVLTAAEYGISMMLLATRARAASIITESAAKSFYIHASSRGWRTNEPTRIEAEKPLLFEQLVFRAVNENEISMQKGAELLKISYDDVAARCCFGEDS